MSTGLECHFVETGGQWYYLLETVCGNRFDWLEDCDAYGPFASFEVAHAHLHDNHANPGGFSQVEYGDAPLPKSYAEAISHAEKPEPRRPNYSWSRYRGFR